MYLFLAVPGLCSCVQTFSSGSAWGLLSSCSMWASHCRLILTVGFSLAVDHSLQAHRLQQMQHSSLAAPWHVASSWTRDRIHVPTLASRFLTIEPPGRSSKYVSFSLWLAFKDYYQYFFFFPFPTLPLLSLPSLPSLCIVSKKFFNMFNQPIPDF